MIWKWKIMLPIEYCIIQHKHNIINAPVTGVCIMLQRDSFSIFNTEQKHLSFEGTVSFNRVWAQLAAVYRPATSWRPRSMILGMYGICISRHGAAIETPKWFEATFHQLRTSALRGMLFVLGLAKTLCNKVVPISGEHHKHSHALAHVNTRPPCATLFFLQWPTFSCYCILRRDYGNQVNITAASFRYEERYLLHNASTGHGVMFCLKAADCRKSSNMCPHAQIKGWQSARLRSSAVKIVHIVMRSQCRVQ